MNAGLLAVAVIACLGSAGCAKTSMSDITGSISGSSQPMPRDESALRAYSEELGERYKRDNRDKATAIKYARSLRALTQNAQAVAVMQALAAQNPKDEEILGEYGKALIEAGRLRQASEVLQNAHTPERPNWSILSAQGSVADQMGEHAQAQQYYVSALKIRPGDPNVLSNLGLSYALARDLPRAESTLIEAANSPKADMRVRQNLALVLALEGKFSEAEEWSRNDLSPLDASANVSAIRRMIAQSNTWRDIKQSDQTASSGKKDLPSRKKTQEE